MNTPDYIRDIRRKIAERKYRAEALAAAYPGAICLRCDQPGNDDRPWIGAAVHRSARTAGRWQVSFFDLDGFSYDFSESTYTAAIDEALKVCCEIVDMGLLDSVVMTPRFMGGVIWSLLSDDKKWTTRLADVRAGLEIGA
jgi:hypothetical protein